MADEIELLRLASELIPEPTTDAWARAKAAIAAAREEDLLRQDTERSTRDLRAPGATSRRVARGRRRRVVLRSLAGAAAALAAVAVALAAAGVPDARHNGTAGPVIPAAYVVKRVSGALDAAGPGEIAQMTVTTRGAVILGGTTATTTAEEWSYGDRWRSVANSSAGHLAYDEGFSTSSVYTLVSYPTRTCANTDWAGQLRRYPVHAAACRPSLPSPCHSSLGCWAPVSLPVRCLRPWPQHFGLRSPADPWPWSAVGSASTGSRQSS